MTPLGSTTLAIAGSLIATYLSILLYVYLHRRTSSSDLYIIVKAIQEENAQLKIENARHQVQIDLLDAERQQIRDERIHDRTQLSAAIIELEMLYDGVKLLTNQIERLKALPDWTPPRNAPTRRVNSRAALMRTIQAKFSLDEMKDLAFDIGIEADKLPSTDKDSVARELVATATRNGTLQDLISRVAELRPEIKSGKA